MKFQLRRIRLNGGGYTDGGQYYGVGSPLYRADASVKVGEGWEDIALVFRAADRDSAVDYLRARFTKATFYRANSRRVL